MFPDITRDDIFRLETPRLWLRWLRASDAPVMTAFAQLADVAQMTATIPHPYPAGAAEKFILASRAETADGAALILGVTLKNKARTLIGIVSASADPDRFLEVEIGYILAPAHWGRGYMTEAVGELVDAVFSLTEARAIHATARTINPASERVLLKCGFASLGTGLADLKARGGHHPVTFFELTRHRWAAKRSRVRGGGLPGMAHQAPATPHSPLQEQSQQQ